MSLALAIQLQVLMDASDAGLASTNTAISSTSFFTVLHLSLQIFYRNKLKGDYVQQGHSTQHNTEFLLFANIKSIHSK